MYEADIKNAIEYLKMQKQLFPNSANVLSGNFDLAVVALEKQMPKKVTAESGKWPDGRKRMSHYCPSCLNELYANQVFCDECGQRLDWRENNGTIDAERS